MWTGPGAGPRAVEHATALAREIVRCKMKIKANCAARTLRQDITPIVEVSQKAGIPIEACTFIGSSPIRQFAENWTLETMLRHTEDAVGYAVSHGLPVMYVTEDTTRAHPKTLEALYGAALEHAAELARLLATMRADDGSITIAGFEGPVRAITDEVRSRIEVDIEHDFEA